MKVKSEQSTARSNNTAFDQCDVCGIWRKDHDDALDHNFREPQSPLSAPQRIWIQRYDKYAGEQGYFYYAPFPSAVEYVRADLVGSQG